MTAKQVELPGKQAVVEAIKQYNAQPSLADRLHAEQVADKQLIVEIQQRMADRRQKIAFVEDTPNAEVMIKALSRFYLCDLPSSTKL